MYLNDLARVLRAAGLKVVEVSNWQGHNHGPMKTPKSVICHHTAGPWGGGNYPSLNTVRNGHPHLKGPLAQLGLGRDGTVYVISNGLSWHAGEVYEPSVYGNYYAIGIEAENAGTGQPWPDVQVKAYARLCAALCKAYGIPVSRVKGHKEVCKPKGRKIDPNGLPGDMAGHRARVQRYLSGGGGSTPSAPVKKRNVEEYDSMLKLETGTHAKHIRFQPGAKKVSIGSPHGPIKNCRVIFYGAGYPKTKAADGVPMFDVKKDVKNPLIHRMRNWGISVPKGAIGCSVYYEYPKPDNRYDSYEGSLTVVYDD